MDDWICTGLVVLFFLFVIWVSIRGSRVRHPDQEHEEEADDA